MLIGQFKFPVHQPYARSGGVVVECVRSAYLNLLLSNNKDFSVFVLAFWPMNKLLKE